MPAFRPLAAAVATLALCFAAAVGVHTVHTSPVAFTAKGRPAAATVEQPARTAVVPHDIIWQWWARR